MCNSKLPSKIKFTFRDIEDDQNYCLDLLQFPDDQRTVALRTTDAEKHELAVRSSVALDARLIRKFLELPNATPEVYTTQGEQFVIDAHRSWLLLDEVIFWKKCISGKIENWQEQQDVWVNGRPPKQLYTNGH